MTGAQLDRIQKTLLAAFTRDELRQLVRTCLDIDFDRIAPDKDLDTQVFELVQWAERRGRSQELVHCAWLRNQANEQVRALWQAMQGEGVAPAPPGAATAALPSQLSGDVIIANIGPGAQNVAVGKNVTQTISTGVPTQPATPHQVFLAYSRADDAAMQRLRGDLLAAGITCWAGEAALEPGTAQWQQAVDEALRTARAVVVLLSPDARASEWVNIEISRAKRLGHPIFSLIMRGSVEDAMPLLLELTEPIDLRVDYASGVQERLLPALRQQLDGGH